MRQGLSPPLSQAGLLTTVQVRLCGTFGAGKLPSKAGSHIAGSRLLLMQLLTSSLGTSWWALEGLSRPTPPSLNVGFALRIRLLQPSPKGAQSL